MAGVQEQRHAVSLIAKHNAVWCAQPFDPRIWLLSWCVRFAAAATAFSRLTAAGCFRLRLRNGSAAGEQCHSVGLAIGALHKAEVIVLTQSGRLHRTRTEVEISLCFSSAAVLGCLRDLCRSLQNRDHSRTLGSRGPWAAVAYPKCIAPLQYVERAILWPGSSRLCVPIRFACTPELRERSDG